ncbi:exodeoxyribonuclease VII large subunit [Candidatus Sororendozoicomonas aggregata]|uniref:exodeoxyribonuclease VII large subunit n=1 Tax=Candidatus Sororendozoicomonas aggregata TaxID=3073239 RepID=UPI002ED256FB
MPYSVISDRTTEAPLSVSQLNGQARRLLETNFNNIRVEGELSSLARPSSGHWYFSLKDDKSQVSCAMFRNRCQRLSFEPKEGMLVRVRGRVSLYEPRGGYQLIVEHMKAAGSGALQQAFEALKKKLAGEGLFDFDRKRSLPATPKHIAVITSPTGAAVRDILAVFKRRSPFIDITVIPAAVQGSHASQELINGLRIAAKTDCDVVIIGRGGGSIEDLWSFNEEALARAIAAHPVPVVSAVGHEVDFTVADFVADQRAPTPSAAAEILSPDTPALLEKNRLMFRKLVVQMRHQLDLNQERLTHVSQRLRHPGDRLREQAQRLDDLEIRLQQAIRLNVTLQRSRLQKAWDRFQQQSPVSQIQQLQLVLKNQYDRLCDHAQKQLTHYQSGLQQLSGKLHAISPLATMARGYAITQYQGSVVFDSRQLHAGDSIQIKLHRGELGCCVTTIQHSDKA